MAIKLHIGPEIIRSYKRLSYSPWYALAEFVDNSTQSYLSHKTELDAVIGNTGLKIGITYNNAARGTLTITDNAMGMSGDELENALHIGKPPLDRSGRSEFGLGMKTAACWFGNYWTVRTKMLGESVAHSIEFNVEDVANNNLDLKHKTIKETPDKHYTVITIQDLNQRIVGQTTRLTKEFLSSMYRVDIRENTIKLLWNCELLSWKSPLEDGNIHYNKGKPCHKEINFRVNKKSVKGWIAVLERGSREKAGFSIIRRGRVIKGSPETWKPQAIFGQYEGSNDLVNQRLVGEIVLDNFGVSHTKDDILWAEDEKTEVELELAKRSEKYIEIARSFRKRGSEGRWPSRKTIDDAVNMFDEELTSPKFNKIVKSNGSIPVDLMLKSPEVMIKSATGNKSDTSVTIDDFEINVFLSSETSDTDPYLGIDMITNNSLNVVINMNHPYVKDLRGSMGVLTHIKSCTYEGVAQWKASKSWNTDNPQVIRTVKDRLLRIGRMIDDEATARK